MKKPVLYRKSIFEGYNYGPPPNMAEELKKFLDGVWDLYQQKGLEEDLDSMIYEVYTSGGGKSLLK